VLGPDGLAGVEAGLDDRARFGSGETEAQSQRACAVQKFALHRIVLSVLSKRECLLKLKTFLN